MNGKSATAMTSESKRALVTGSAQGIGRAIAEALLDTGASVAMLDKAGIPDAGLVERAHT